MIRPLPWSRRVKSMRKRSNSFYKNARSSRENSPIHSNRKLRISSSQRKGRSHLREETQARSLMLSIRRKTERMMSSLRTLNSRGTGLSLHSSLRSQLKAIKRTVNTWRLWRGKHRREQRSQRNSRRKSRDQQIRKQQLSGREAVNQPYQLGYHKCRHPRN